MSSTRDASCLVLLCAVGGWVDASSYLRFATFSGAMSGNTVLLGLAVAEGKARQAGFHAVVILSFLAAVMAARLWVERGGRPGPVLLASALLVALAAAVPGRWSVCAAALAMGTQNASIRCVGGVSLNTVFVTGDLEKLGETITGAGPGRKSRALLLALAWGSYGFGAAAGAAAGGLPAGHPGEGGDLAPALLSLLAAALAWRRGA